MSQEKFSLAVDILGKENVESYLDIARDKAHEPDIITIDDAILLYKNNANDCGQLYPYLNLLELALRNKVHKAVGNSLKIQDWMLKVFEIVNVSNIRDLSSRLEEVKNNKLISTLNDHDYSLIKVICKNAIKIMKDGKELTEGRLIASMEFFIWTNLLNKSYHKKFGGQDYFNLIFSNISYVKNSHRYKKDSFKNPESFLRDEITKLRWERNRVFHHEKLKGGLIKTRDRIDVVLRAIDPNTNYFV